MNKSFDVRIGINPISWTNDEARERKAAERRTEYGGKLEHERVQADRVGEVLARHQRRDQGLARRSVEQEITAVRPHLELLASNGASVMVYGEVADSVQGTSVPLCKRPRFFRDEQWREYADKLTALARYTLQHGVRVAYHHHMGAYVETPADIDRLMSLVGEEVGLLFDTGHITFAGGDAVAMLDKEGSGVVLSSINGRNETRIYAKPIEHGASRINLSGEEEEAIRRALGAVRR